MIGGEIKVEPTIRGGKVGRVGKGLGAVLGGGGGKNGRNGKNGIGDVDGTRGGDGVVLIGGAAVGGGLVATSRKTHRPLIILLGERHGGATSTKCIKFLDKSLHTL
jgi:hypothetical protein